MFMTDFTIVYIIIIYERRYSTCRTVRYYVISSYYRVRFLLQNQVPMGISYKLPHETSINRRSFDLEIFERK